MSKVWAAFSFHTLIINDTDKYVVCSWRKNKIPRNWRKIFYDVGEWWKHFFVFLEQKLDKRSLSDPEKNGKYSFLRIITFEFKTVRDLFISASGGKRCLFFSTSVVKNRQKGNNMSIKSELAPRSKKSTNVQHIFLSRFEKKLTYKTAEKSWMWFNPWTVYKLQRMLQTLKYKRRCVLTWLVS